MTMTNTTTTTTTTEPHYAFLKGALKVSLKHFSGDLLRAGVITHEQIETVNKLAAEAYEYSHAKAVEFKAKHS